MNRTYLLDLGERVGWTAAQAGLGVVTVEALHVPMAWAPIVATGLAALKGIVAKHVGNRESASTLPAEVQAEQVARDDLP